MMQFIAMAGVDPGFQLTKRQDQQPCRGIILAVSDAGNGDMKARCKMSGRVDKVRANDGRATTCMVF